MMAVEEPKQAVEAAEEGRTSGDDQPPKSGTGGGNHQGTNRSADLLRQISAGWERVASWFSIIAAVMGTLVGMFTLFATDSERRVSTEKTTAALEEVLADQRHTIADVYAKMKDLQDHLASLSNIPKENGLYIEMKRLESSVEDVSSRESKLEAAIMQSPSKALEVPLLRRDLDNLRDSQQSTFAALKDSIDRIYDLNKWLLGAMAISIVTLAIGNLLKPKEPKP